MTDALPITDALPPPASAVSTPLADPLLIAGKRFAQLMAVSMATFNRWKAAGKLPKPIELSRGCHRWRLSEVQTWIEAKCPPIREWEARNASAQRRQR